MQFPLNKLKESQILKRLEYFFDADVISQKAITTGFVKRKSKLCALSFLQLCLIHTHTACAKSLSEACTFLREVIGVRLRKQSLDSRFNVSALLFIRKLVEELMKSQICMSLAYPNRNTQLGTNSFKRILIGDSTAFSLPSSFTASYKGAGGECILLRLSSCIMNMIFFQAL